MFKAHPPKLLLTRLRAKINHAIFSEINAVRPLALSAFASVLTVVMLGGVFYVSEIMHHSMIHRPVTQLEEILFILMKVIFGMMIPFSLGLFAWMGLARRRSKLPDFSLNSTDLNHYRAWISTQPHHIQSLAPPDPYVTQKDINILKSLAQLEQGAQGVRAQLERAQLQNALGEQTEVVRPTKHRKM